MTEDVTTNAPSKIEDLKPGMAVSGTVKRLELYGAFVDIGIGQDGLLHISQLGKTKVRNLEDVLKVGETIQAFVLKVDAKAGRIALTTIKPPDLPWEAISQGQTYQGKVIRMEKFGVFVDIGAERPGMVHVSELADGFVKDPSDIVSEGQEVTVRVLKVNRGQRKIDLSMREQAEEIANIIDEDDENLPTAMEMAFRRANADDDGANEDSRSKRAKASKKRRQEQAEIIARMMRGD
ncbi:MAG: S1 RNA-binding domain-containing protein [Anaerolineaceae bacterium]|nr:MAG: S1 RNA-binding domain-containing protein [Anaerolineaceae bacterium]